MCSNSIPTDFFIVDMAQQDYFIHFGPNANCTLEVNAICPLPESQHLLTCNKVV